MSNTTANPLDAKILSTAPLTNENARWTKLVLTTYNDPLGKKRTWEHAERSTRPAESLIDGVGIIAVLTKPSGPEIVLQKQFRPPVGKVTIEIPAGLVDAGEGAAESAVRELKEETGYVGTVAQDVGVVLFNAMTAPSSFSSFKIDIANPIADPGFCNTNLNLVHVTVDTSLPENINPEPQLEENEFIEVFSIPLRELYAGCKKWEAEGYAIDARVGTLAEGIELGKKWGV